MGNVTCSQCGKSFGADEVVQVEGAAVCAACKPIALQKVKEGVGVSASLNYAGIWVRFVAIFVDGILLQIVNFVLGLVVGGAMVSAESETVNAGPFILINILSILIGALYEILLVGKYGATLGKMAMKLRVVTPEGQPIGFGAATGRYFAKILSGLILAIGYIMAAFDGEKRALHDRICGTRVIRL